MIGLLFVIMLHHETPINKRQIALTARFFGYAGQFPGQLGIMPGHLS
jgi:hypothetical protein